MLRRTVPRAMSFPTSAIRPTGFASVGAACGLVLGTSVAYMQTSDNATNVENDHKNAKGRKHHPRHHRNTIPSPPTKDELYGTTPLYDNPGVEKLIFEHVTEEYNDLGQIEKEEVQVTVQDNVFSQIGVIDTKGTRDMYFAWLGAAHEYQLRKRLQHIRKLNRMSVHSHPSSAATKDESVPKKVVEEVSHWDNESQEKEISNATNSGAASSAVAPAVAPVADVVPAPELDKDCKRGRGTSMNKFLMMSGMHPPSLVFCDIGSGVGNVCLQVLGEVPACPKVIGIEIIPSRHKNAQIAFENAQKYFPTYFGAPSTTISNRRRAPWHLRKSASFYEVDLVNCAQTLRDEKVGVVFSHSWMFDDDLMKKFANVVNNVSKPVLVTAPTPAATPADDAGAVVAKQYKLPPSLWCVITSRPFVDTVTGEPLLDTSRWELHSERQFSADWNPNSHFFMYTRKV